MERRDFLAVLAAGTVGALTASTVAGCASPVPAAEITLSGTLPSPLPATPATPSPSTAGLLPPAVGARHPLPAEPITALPGRGRHIALTVDDGASPEVIGAYVKFAQDTGARFTFFVTGSFDGWTEHRAELRPLVESGQIQLGNHTWSHPALTELSARGVADELGRTKRFLKNEFGVDGTPYYRPPFGYHDAAVDAVAADLGYTMPTLWYGSLSDSGLITEKYLIQCARKYFRPQSIIIGHANHDPVTKVYPKLVEIIRHRKLRMVTLDDYFATGP
ncbi:polysaccharide deacetylase family protein [Gordonia jinghuaiqii]|uniref:Polysaccharide deacetylase family protein n=1 Tax=Gordonia jinghuaiqii TaxID=2758710 RepID=A0A7D7R9T5_9ACTN|nr:polysaccharide deacetylase family protein [Gordonia jinghuaiqii]MCR5979175.1 polysaccharide deacetylase family protein [Gordonia jinghuaiqii]QMT00970.1 polysaccharide deacetylase family protein [Gordonia jinghuaiqii]